jgi:hypothetical protein
MEDLREMRVEITIRDLDRSICEPEITGFIIIIIIIITWRYSPT